MYRATVVDMASFVNTDDLVIIVYEESGVHGQMWLELLFSIPYQSQGFCFKVIQNRNLFLAALELCKTCCFWPYDEYAQSVSYV